MLFFFSGAGKKKQPFEIESVSAFQTFPGKKKKQIKKKTTFGRKKKIEPKSQNWKNKIRYLWLNSPCVCPAPTNLAK